MELNSTITKTTKKMNLSNENEKITTDFQSKRTEANLVSNENTEIYSSGSPLKPLTTTKKKAMAATSSMISLSKRPTSMASSILETPELNKKKIIDEKGEKDEAELQKFEILYVDFKQTSKPASTYFILDLLKFIILSLIIVFDRDHPFRQSIFISSICFSMILFLVLVRPFKSNYLFMLNIISQTCVLFCTCAVVVLAYYDYVGSEDQDGRFLVGKIFVFGTMVLIYLMTVIFICHTLIHIMKIVKFILKSLGHNSKKNSVFTVVPFGSSMDEA